GAAQFSVAGKLRIEVEGGECDVAESYYCPEYGVRTGRSCLKLRGSGIGKTEILFRCTYCF
ncbi:MAG: hypothetical protein ACP5MD_16235, partial [Verrucomicrobiia bacterium]